MKKIINVGIVAHVDAGKTSLTESLYSKTHSNYKQGSIKKGEEVKIGLNNKGEFIILPS